MAKRPPGGTAGSRALTKTRQAKPEIRLRTGRNTVPLYETGRLTAPVQGEEEQRVLTLAQAATQWTYIVRNRGRWSALPDLQKQQASDAAELLKGFGVKDSDLQEFASAQMVEVCVPWTENEADNWPARILPWEYVIASATQDLRGDNALAVIRHMECRGAAHPSKAAKKRVLFVASEPGPLKGWFQFGTERELVQYNLAGAGNEKNWQELHNPTAQELIDKLHDWKPDIVHFAGVDTHQALSMLAQIEKEDGRPFHDLWDSDPTKDPNDPARQVPVKDGYVLKGTTKMLNAVEAEQLANILRNENKDTGVSHPPRFVAFNFYNSAARVASLAVTRGVESAIGFQDRFDDDLAERFFAFLYRQIDWSDWNTAIAFRYAFERVRSQPLHQQGSGVVHWSTTPLLTDQARLNGINTKLKKIREDLEVLQPDKVTPDEVGKLVKVTVKPSAEINYSTLHNNRALFNKFTLAPISRTGGRNKPVHRILQDMTVTVSLDVGDGTATYRQTLDVEYPFKDLSSDIHLPLTSTLTRAVHESINTSMLVDIVWGKHVLYRDSLRIRLTPVDQWRDSDSDRRWLPSFVFPRDRAVSDLIDKAQRYVRVLRDDPAAGFDGYQSVNPAPPVSTEEVDLQVQAIWSAIVHEMGLTYINPPPGYSSTLDSQRLRTPSMVRDYHSGTCIDLALLFAACLELIDVYPVIFLLQGHAYPGYWRWDRYHEQFLQTRFDQVPGRPEGTEGAEGADVQDDTWFFKQDTCREIVRYIQEGKLVPLETVRLTENCGFWEAVEAGMENFADPGDFEAMVDIKLARDRLVTPLPILGEQA